MTGEFTQIPAKRVAGSVSTGTLKLLALVCMVLDHLGAAFFPGVMDLRIIGRMAFPLYAWCVVVGVAYTRNPLRYLLRLLAVGLLSQPFYVLGMRHGWTELNVFATLALGMMGAAGIHNRRYGSQIWAPALAMLISLLFKVDYGWRGVLLIMLLYAAREQKGAIAAVMIAFSLYWGTSYSTINSIFGMATPAKLAFLPYADTLLTSVFKLQFFAVLALPLMLIDLPNARLPKWAAYAFYPAHLCVIMVIRFLA